MFVSFVYHSPSQSVCNMSGNRGSEGDTNGFHRLFECTGVDTYHRKVDNGDEVIDFVIKQGGEERSDITINVLTEANVYFMNDAGDTIQSFRYGKAGS